MDEDEIQAEIAVEADRQDRASRTADRLETISNRAHTDRVIFAWIIGAVLVLVAVVGVALVLKYQDDAEQDRQQQQLADAVAEIIEVRTESRVGSCQQDNIRIVQHNVLVQAMAGVIDLAAAPNPDRTADQQAKVAEFAAKSHALLDTSIVDQRDCSPEGIEAYLSAKAK